MPDFRARVHARRDVPHRRRPLRHRLLARDEPGGPQGRRRGGRARAGRSSAATNMGDIFRRNAFNLGLHVVQCPEAVADAQDGDAFALRPGDARALTNETAGQDATSRCRSPPRKRRSAASGGIFAVGPARVPRRRSARAPRDRVARRRDGARRMTTTEQIVWAHRVDKDAAVRPGRDAARLRRPAAGLRRHRAVRDPHLQPDHRRRRDLSRARRRSRTTTSSSPARRPTTGRPSIGREFAGAHGIEQALLRDARATASSTSTSPSRGWSLPGQFIPGADSHSRAYGAYGAVGIGVGSTTLGFGWATGYVYFTLAAAAPRRLRRAAPAVGQRQGHRARAARALGREAVAGACRSSSSTRAGSSRSPTATRSPT